MKGYLPFSVASVALTISFIACGRNKTERQFAAFVDKHVAVVEPLMKELNLSYWDATASGRVEDYDRYGKLQLDLRRVYSNREEFAQLKAFKESGKIKQPLLARQLTLLYNTYLENQIDTTLTKQLVELSTAIENQFNTFRGKIDGKEVTGNQILDLLKGERQSDTRRKAWEASKQVGPVVAEHVVELVELRNEAARQLGFDNFYTMRLTLAEQDEAELVKLFDELQRLTDEPFRQLKVEIDSIFEKR